MSRYIPPTQSKFMQIVDSLFVLVAVFVTLWLPLELGIVDTGKSAQPRIFVEDYVKLEAANAALAAAETPETKQAAEAATAALAAKWTEKGNAAWKDMGQNDVMAAAWEKLGYTPQSAHDTIIQQRFNYEINWGLFFIVAIVVLGYFVILFRLSDQEYREVIDEKFGHNK